MTIRFRIDNGKAELEIEDDALLVFIDETGIEDFSDPNFPIFGMGGCVSLATDYEKTIRPNWIAMRDQIFGAKSLHASELKAPNQDELESLVENLSSELFTRVVAVASSKSAFPDGYVPYNPVASCLISRIASAAVRFRFSRILVFVESATRINDLAVKYLGYFDKCNIENEAGKYSIPIEYYFLPKSLNEPGLEIADFIMHTVGAQARNTLLNPEQAVRKDYKAIITDVPRKSVEYLSIDKVEINVA